MVATHWDNVAERFGMRRALPFARGSAGLYALFSVLRQRHGEGEVVVPASCCEAVAMAAIFSGHTLRFADTSNATLGMTAETLAPLLNARTRAVVVIHLYGIETSTEQFRSLRESFPQTVFIEDLAHALGGKSPNGTLLGGSLDVALLSFAESKIVPGDGGLLLFPEDSPLADEVGDSPLSREVRMEHPRLASSLRNFVHGIADSWREHPQYAMPPVFAQMLESYRELIAMPGGIADEARAAIGLDRLQPNRERRYENYMAYRAQIDTPNAAVVPMHELSMCWRCPVLFANASAASAATAALRKVSIPASNHYFPLSVLLPTPGCPVAESAGLRILNLWVNSDTSRTSIDAAARIINTI